MKNWQPRSTCTLVSAGSLGHGLVCLLNGGGLQLKDGQHGLCVLGVHHQVVHLVHLAPQLVPHWVKGLVRVHLSSEVVARGKVLEPVEVVPVASSTATGVMVHNLGQP